MVCSLLVETLCDAVQILFCLPQRVCIHADNTNTDTKNTIVIFACAWILAHLQHTKLEGFDMVFLVVGHTRDIKYAIFSYINKTLHGEDVLSLPQLLPIVHSARSACVFVRSDRAFGAFALGTIACRCLRPGLRSANDTCVRPCVGALGNKSVCVPGMLFALGIYVRGCVRQALPAFGRQRSAFAFARSANVLTSIVFGSQEANAKPSELEAPPGHLGLSRGTDRPSFLQGHQRCLATRTTSVSLGQAMGPFASRQGMDDKRAVGASHVLVRSAPSKAAS